MNELTFDEINEVNGGVVWFIPAAKIGYSLVAGATGAYGLGYVLGKALRP